MKKILLLCAAAMMAAVGASAQQLKVTDSEGNAVAYASVMNAKAEYIGITDLDGVLADVKGAAEVIVTHVAFKTKNVTLNGKDTVVVLEDADFDMPEITVEPKPFIYVQTFYRLYIYTSEDGIFYYRAGLTDNTYDPAKKTVKGKTEAASKAESALLKTLFGMVGVVFNDYSQIKPKSFEERMMEHGKASKVKFTAGGQAGQTISDYKGVIGSVTDDMADHLRRYSYDSYKLFLHNLEAKGREKDLKRLEKKVERNEKRKNKVESDYFLYRIDDSGHYGPEDFVMSQNMSSWDEEEDGKTKHYIIAMQVFCTDRAYVTKDELKERVKRNKMKMNYQNIRRFEQDHHIPSLPAAVQQKLSEIWKAGD